MKIFENISSQDASQSKRSLKRIFYPVTEKILFYHSYLSDIILTVQHRAASGEFLGAIPSPQKIKGYSRVHGDKNGWKFEPFPPD